MVILDIRYGDEEHEHTQIDINNNETFRILKEKVCSETGLDKENIHIVKNDSQNNKVYWKIMDDNSIVDSMRSDPDSLVVYTFEEYIKLYKDTESDYDSEY